MPTKTTPAQRAKQAANAAATRARNRASRRPETDDVGKAALWYLVKHVIPILDEQQAARLEGLLISILCDIGFDDKAATDKYQAIVAEWSNTDWPFKRSRRLNDTDDGTEDGHGGL